MPVRVALFATCLGDQFFADACADTVRLLRHLGVEVRVPAGQTCCGQPAYNAGRRGEAVRMARHTLDVLAGTDYVVLPSGSCAGMIKCLYPALLPEGPSHTPSGPSHAPSGPSRSPSEANSSPADALAARTYELSQFLVDVLGVGSLGEGLRGLSVGYHHSCHALRELGVRSAPPTLLAGCGAEVLPWIAAEECCGFGGLFSAKLPEVSAGMADRKLDTLPNVDVVTSSDGGCLLQLSGRAAHRASTRGRAASGTPGPRFEHLASLLWRGVRS